MTWLGRLRRRSGREALADVLVLGGLTALVVLVYVVIVLGGGSLIGHTASPHVGLSVLATAVVALAFDPVQTRLESFATRTVHGGQPSPYDVLRRFTETLIGSHAAEELPARMARVLADGTGAAWSQVWIVVGDRPTLAATWPPHAAPEDVAAEAGALLSPVPGRRALPVLHRGELLGVLVVQERKHVALTSVEERLFAGLAGQAGLGLRGARLRAELELRAEELSARAAELRASRQRLVDVQDEKRRLLERDIHDGAQQHLVALAVNLRLAHTLSSGAPERVGRLLGAQEHAAAEAIDTLVQLSRGIFPPTLAEEGLASALRAAAENLAMPVEVAASHVGRYPPSVESAAYFCCLEALQNAAKHSGATGVLVTLTGEPETLSLTVEDDGTGFDPLRTSAGAGLTNMRDRVESVGGTLTTETTAAGGTRVRARLPVSRAALPLGHGA